MKFEIEEEDIKNWVRDHSPEWVADQLYNYLKDYGDIHIFINRLNDNLPEDRRLFGGEE